MINFQNYKGIPTSYFTYSANSKTFISEVSTLSIYHNTWVTINPDGIILQSTKTGTKAWFQKVKNHFSNENEIEYEEYIYQISDIGIEPNMENVRVNIFHD